jgi:hypothetical protein
VCQFSYKNWTRPLHLDLRRLLRFPPGAVERLSLKNVTVPFSSKLHYQQDQQYPRFSWFTLQRLNSRSLRPTFNLFHSVPVIINLSVELRNRTLSCWMDLYISVCYAVSLTRCTVLTLGTTIWGFSWCTIQKIHGCYMFSVYAFLYTRRFAGMRTNREIHSVHTSSEAI